MSPSNPSNVEVIVLLDDSDAEDTSLPASAGSSKRRSPTSVTTHHSDAGKSGKRQKKSSSGSSGFVANANAIEIVDSDAEDNNRGAPPAAAAAAAAVPEKKVAIIPSTGSTAAAAASAKRAAFQSRTSSSLDSDIVEVTSSSSSSSSEWRAVASSSSSSSSSEPRGNLKDDRAYDNESTNYGDDKEESEEEFTIVATKGQNALADFPHSRANCVTHPFASCDKKLHCVNCYCYVCDIPATDCKEWDSHCAASHDDPRWRQEREQHKRRAKQAAQAPLQAAAAGASTSSSSLSTSNAARRTFHWSSRSRSTTTTNANLPRAEFSVRKLLEKVTTVHPVEMEPPAGSPFITSLRHYQKQSLAFMVEVERGSGGRASSNSTRGGWLADEVGMGKSAVMLSLVVSNPASAKDIATAQGVRDHWKLLKKNDKEYYSKLDCFDDKKRREEEFLLQKCDSGSYECRRFHENRMKERRELIASLRPLKDVEKLRLKGTVILTSVSLMGQWEDEVKKHAPGLVVKTFHQSRRNDRNYIPIDKGSWDVNVMMQLSKADVIISTSTFSWPAFVCSGFEFHRVAQDESHLFIKGPSAKYGNANDISSPHRWCVTATPMTGSVSDLKRQIYFIRGQDESNGLRPLFEAIDQFREENTERRFNRLAEMLQLSIIRHTKAQRINGSEALSLPPSTTSTIMLDLSENERHALGGLNVSASNCFKHCKQGATSFVAERLFQFQMTANTSSEAGRKMVQEIGHRSKPWSKSKYIYKPESLTKVVALRRDLAALRQSEPLLRAVVFTHFLTVHDTCVRGLEADGFQVFQFTGSSSSKDRDKAIRQFQSDKKLQRPAVFVITLRSGNVGITLTAASRVYLMEPCLDPAVEVQAAGRIHRLGQNKPCHVVKFVFKNCYENNILALHKEMLAGRVDIVDGFVPPKAMKILSKGLLPSHMWSHL